MSLLDFRTGITAPTRDHASDGTREDARQTRAMSDQKMPEGTLADMNVGHEERRGRRRTRLVDTATLSACKDFPLTISRAIEAATKSARQMTNGMLPGGLKSDAAPSASDR